jgi:cyclase
LLRPRIISCLLIHEKGLVKTVKFKDPKYVGDPINAVRIFNEKEVDEIMVVDIDATIEGRDPDYSMIENLAAECRMPLCYGGGITNADQIKKIIQLGVEKVAISAAIIENPDLIPEATRRVGNQSVVVVLDVKKRKFSDKYDVWVHNAKKNTKRNPFELAKECEQKGIGELVINFIDKDGCMNGYDFKFIDQIYNHVNVPVTVLGGAGSLADIGRLINRYGVIGAAAGSLFVFKGKYRAVLINYPNQFDKEEIIKQGNLAKQYLH